MYAEEVDLNEFFLHSHNRKRTVVRRRLVQRLDLGHHHVDRSGPQPDRVRSSFFRPSQRAI